MKATDRFTAFTKVMGSILGFMLLFVMSTSFQPIPPPEEGIIEKAFTLDNFAKETIELNIELPGTIVATAEWDPKKAELAFILFGPGQMNYYRRSDGKSPLELKYTLSELDIAEGTDWRIKLVNQSGESVEGILHIRYPVAEQGGEANTLQ